MPALVVERHRDIRDDLVDDLFVGAGLAEQGVLPAPALDELGIRVLGDKIADRLLVLRERIQAGEHDIEKLVGGPVGRVAVAVDKAGQDQPFSQVDHFRCLADMHPRPGVAADVEKLAVLYGERLGDAPAAIDRVNVAVLQDEVGGCRIGRLLPGGMTRRRDDQEQKQVNPRTDNAQAAPPSLKAES